MMSSYCLILSDLNMPIMDGYEFAPCVRQLFASQGVIKEEQPRLIAVTGNVERRYIKRCFEVDFD